VIPEDLAFRGVLHGALNKGGEISGPDDRAWGFRGVAMAALRSLAAPKVRELAPVSVLRALITLTADPITLTADPIAPHPRDHRGDQQNDHQRDADHDSRGTHTAKATPVCRHRICLCLRDGKGNKMAEEGARGPGDLWPDDDVDVIPCRGGLVSGAGRFRTAAITVDSRTVVVTGGEGGAAVTVDVGGVAGPGSPPSARHLLP
jgi:hypothetical protein